MKKPTSTANKQKARPLQGGGKPQNARDSIATLLKAKLANAQAENLAWRNKRWQRVRPKRVLARFKDVYLVEVCVAVKHLKLEYKVQQFVVFGDYYHQCGAFDDLKNAWRRFFQCALQRFYNEAWSACEDGSGFELTPDIYEALEHANDLQTEEFRALEAMVIPIFAPWGQGTAYKSAA